MSDSVRPHRRQPTRLLCLWDSPGKNTGVGFHFLLQCRKVKSESEVAQSCRLLATPWTAAHQAPLSVGFARQEYWSGVPLIYTLLDIKETIPKTLLNSTGQSTEHTDGAGMGKTPKRTEQIHLYIELDQVLVNLKQSSTHQL